MDGDRTEADRINRYIADLEAANERLRAAITRALDDLGRRDELSAIDGLSAALAEESRGGDP